MPLSPISFRSLNKRIHILHFRNTIHSQGHIYACMFPKNKVRRKFFYAPFELLNQHFHKFSGNAFYLKLNIFIHCRSSLGNLLLFLFRRNLPWYKVNMIALLHFSCIYRRCHPQHRLWIGCVLRRSSR